MGRGVMEVVTKLDGKARIVRKFKRRRGCSSPRQLCLSCQVVIHPNDKFYASKVCRSCTEKQVRPAGRPALDSVGAPGGTE